ncbi:MAG: carboxypeptidase-like regulatory domain-containing protein, partial [Bacteroidota bacterium]
MPGKIFYTIVLVSLFQFVTFANTSLNGKTSDTKSKKSETINFTVTVTDKDASIPLQSVIVIMKKNNSIIAKTSTNAFGRAQFNDLETGSYSLAAYYVGYNDFITNVDVDVLHKTFDVKLSEKNVEMNEVVVKGDKINKVATTIDVSNGQQVFEGATYHAAPTSQMSTLIQQNLAGAARAPTGEVHIRGQHGEFTYLVDGIPIPLGVFGGLNEIVDPKVITRVNFLTGGFPAEYGGQITGIMDIQNRVPTGKFHLDFSTYAGSYLTSNNDSLGSRVGTLKALNSNGQSLSFSDHIGKLGYFVSTSRQETDRRIDQPVR